MCLLLSAVTDVVTPLLHPANSADGSHGCRFHLFNLHDLAVAQRAKHLNCCYKGKAQHTGYARHPFWHSTMMIVSIGKPQD